MQLTCPACNKTLVSTLASVHTCDRCGCDLSTLRDILLAATALLHLAKSALEQGAWEEALAHAGQSWTLVHSAPSTSVACLAAAALGDPDMLALWRRRAE